MINFFLGWLAGIITSAGLIWFAIGDE